MTQTELWDLEEDEDEECSDPKNTLTKEKMSQLLADEIGLNKREAKETVDAFFEIIINTLANSETVRISNFGKFVFRDKKARVGRNPKTGETLEVSQRRIVTFLPSPKLKTVLNSKEN